jgi:D,D-heptose 1,7-bisphosphate phosphatase
MKRPAVFLDRDDTLVVDPGFIDHPEKVELMPGAVEAVNRLHTAGYRVVVVSNQSGVARGLFDEQRLEAIHDRLRSLLADGGAALDGIYYCPYLEGPEAKVEAYRRRSTLRKPEPGMLFEAASEQRLDLGRSWMIGDAARDIEAGRRAGCRTILVAPEGKRGSGASNGDRADAMFRVQSLLEAVKIVERETDQSSTIEMRGEQPSEDDSVRLLSEIRNLLDRQQREASQEDFSLLRLVATVVQMLALVVGIWGVFDMFQDALPEAQMRFALAIFLQLLALTMSWSAQRR